MTETSARVVDIPTSLTLLQRQREADAEELERLREVERDLSRPVVELAHELARLRRIEEAAIVDMAKVERHERLGYKRISVGAFAATRAALEE